MTDDRWLPQRLRERSFRTFEHVITEAVNEFPKVLKITPKGNQLTYTYRLRDAMLSLYRYRWQPTTVNMTKFLQIYSENLSERKLKVGQTSNVVEIGDLTLPPSEKESVVEVSEEQTTEVFNLDWSLDPGQLSLIAFFAHSRLINRPVRITTVLTEAVHDLEDSYDVSVTNNNDGTYTII